MISKDELVDLLVDGESPHSAIRHLMLEADPGRIGYIVRMPDLISVPDARCLAQHLPKGRRPTRAEAEKAIAMCSGKA